DSPGTDPPTVDVPMPPRREVGVVPEHAVGAPGDEVCDARRDLEAAAWADVRFHGLHLGHRLGGAFATPAHLAPPPPAGESIDVEFGMLLASTGRATARSVRACHGCQSRRRRGIRS